MCGIGGYFGSKEIPDKLLKGAISCLINRGPDRQKVKTYKVGDKFLNLLFTRLSIIDLSLSAMQPMEFNDHVIILNGEIYNYKKLKKNLNKNFSELEWKSNGDVEVALKYLVLNGINSIKDFDGMFALALLDKRNKILYLARDFFGEKPFYFQVTADGIYFGSEPKLIKNLKSENFKINEYKLKKFIKNGYKFIFKTKDNFFLNLERVNPGHIITVKLDKQNDISTKPFRKIKYEVNKNTNLSREAILKKIKMKVIQSVARRLESDVPISICLSGGIDSSLIAAIAKLECGIKLSAYTLVSEDPRYSEESSARMVTKFLNLNHSLVQISKNGFLDRLRNLVTYHESPISTISYYVQSFLMEEIKKDGFKISLMGTGADELFTGYYSHQLFNLASLKKLDEELYSKSLNIWKTKIAPDIRNPRYLKINNYFKEIDKEALQNHLNLKLNDNILMTDNDNNTFNLLRDKMLNELFFEVVPVILHEDDLNSMMYSIENRSPYLNIDLLELMLKIGDKELINNGFTKSLLREAFKGFLPDEILFSLKKIGFNAALNEICDFKDPRFYEFLNDKSDFWTLVQQDQAIKTIYDYNLNDLTNLKAFNLITSKMFYDIFSN